MTSVYRVSFFIAGRQRHITRGRAVRLHRRLECPVGAVRVAGSVRVRSPDSGRQLQRSGLLITGLARSLPPVRLLLIVAERSQVG